MKDIGKIIASHSKISLRSKIIAFLQGVNKNIDQRIDHKASQKQNCREQIQPSLQIIFFHTLISLFLLFRGSVFNTFYQGFDLFYIHVQGVFTDMLLCQLF